MMTTRRMMMAGLMAAVFLVGAMRAAAGFNIYVQMEIGGDAVEGETTVAALGGIDLSSDHLECVASEHEVYDPGASSGRPSGRKTAGAYKLVKRVDKSTPLLMRALIENQRVDAQLKFFRANPDTGETEHYLSVYLGEAALVSVRSWQPSSLDQAGAVLPFMEELQLVPRTIRWVHEIEGGEYQWSVGGAT